MTPSPRLLSQARTVLAAASLSVGAVALAAPSALAAPATLTDPAPAPTGATADGPGSSVFYPSGWTSSQDCVCAFVGDGMVTAPPVDAARWAGTVGPYMGGGAHVPVAQLADHYVSLASSTSGTFDPLSQVTAFDGLRLNARDESYAQNVICQRPGAVDDLIVYYSDGPGHLAVSADGRRVDYSQLNELLPEGQDSAIWGAKYHLSVRARGGH